VGVKYELYRAGGTGMDAGVSAIYKIFKIIWAHKDLDETWAVTKKSPLFPPGYFIIHPGVISSGPTGVTVPTVIPDVCTVDYAIFYPPQEEGEDIKHEIEEVINAVARTDPWLKMHPPKIEWNTHLIPHYIRPDHPIVKTTSRAFEQVTGYSAKINGYTAGSNAWMLYKYGTPAVMFSPGSLLQAHRMDEYVEVDGLVTAAKVMAMTAMDWCGL